MGRIPGRVQSHGSFGRKTKQLIGLAVAAQIPCAYCVYAHTKFAKAAGATDAQIKEARCNRRARPFQQHICLMARTAATMPARSLLQNERRPPTEGGLLFTFVQRLPGVAFNTALIAAGIAVAIIAAVRRHSESRPGAPRRRTRCRRGGTDPGDGVATWQLHGFLPHRLRGAKVIVLVKGDAGLARQIDQGRSKKCQRQDK